MKNKVAIAFSGICLALILLPVTALATDVPATSGTCGDSATWNYDQNTKTLTISGSGEIVAQVDESKNIPFGQWRSEIEKVEFSGNSFTAIRNCAFMNLSRLTSISIPEGVTEIHHEAFTNCTSLSNVIIPEGVTMINQMAFRGCTNLTHIEVPASFSICYNGVGIMGDVGSLFAAIPSPFLTSAGPKGSGSAIEYGWANTIPTGAFIGCRALTQIIIPNTVIEIGDHAFASTGLTSLTIPATVTKLGYNVFGGCQNLSHVTIQADASAISPNRPLYEGQCYNSATNKTETACPLLTSVGPIGSNSSIEIGWDTIPASAFAGCVGLQTITIPETVKTIGDQAFNTCTGLTQITIPDTVTTIGSRAISYCPNLKVLNIPASVIRINNGHDGMFGGCTNLEAITVDPENTVYTAQDGALFSKEKTTLYCVPQGKSGFTIPVGVNKIENGAFSGCTKLTEINIPSGVTEIGYDAFTDCSGLTKLVIPDGVMSNFFNFRGCTALTEVTLPGSANYYSSINGPSLTTVRILEGTKEISGTFSGVTTLTDVYLPASLTHISQNTFANCSNLKNVYFAGTQAQWDALTIADGNQELSLATVVCTGAGENPPVDPDNPDIPAPPETLGITAAPGGLGQRLTVQVQSGHWLTIQTRRAGSIAISSIQAPTSAGGMVTVAFSAPSGSIVQVWETENELTFVNGVPTNPILKTVVKEL